MEESCVFTKALFFNGLPRGKTHWKKKQHDFLIHFDRPKNFTIEPKASFKPNGACHQTKQGRYDAHVTKVQCPGHKVRQIQLGGKEQNGVHKHVTTGTCTRAKRTPARTTTTTKKTTTTRTATTTTVSLCPVPPPTSLPPFPSSSPPPPPPTYHHQL